MKLAAAFVGLAGLGAPAAAQEEAPPQEVAAPAAELAVSQMAAEEDSTPGAPVPIDRFTRSPGGVDMRSGVFTYENVDLSIGNGDSAIALKRTEGSVIRTERMGNFSHNWDIYITEAGRSSVGLISLVAAPLQMSVTAEGRSASFRSESSVKSIGSAGSPASPMAAKLDRAAIGNSYYYVYTAEDGTIITFSEIDSARCQISQPGKCAYATKVELPDGTTYQLSYDNLGTTNALLRRVVSNRGFALLFEYTVSGGASYISTACALNLSRSTLPASSNCPTGVRTATYAYSGNFMTQFVDASNAVWNFTNTFTTAGADYNHSYYRPGEATPYLTNTYTTSPTDPFVRYVSAQAFSGGDSYSYGFKILSMGDYSPGAEVVAGGNYTHSGGTVHVTYGNYQPPKQYNDKTPFVTPKPESVTDELGRVVITANYCMPFPNGAGCRVSPVQWVKSPEGNTTSYTYDSALNVTQSVIAAKPGSGLASITTSATFCGGAKCRKKPLTVTDANNNTTNYTYVPEHGGVLTETQPADVNGIQPVKRYAYVQRYAWISDGAGGYVQAASPVWLPSTVKACATTATISDTCAGGTADETVTTYEYGPDAGPNNLWLRGTAVTWNGTTMRTCYAYDGNGNRISETKPRAGLTVCP